MVVQRAQKQARPPVDRTRNRRRHRPVRYRLTDTKLGNHWEIAESLHYIYTSDYDHEQEIHIQASADFRKVATNGQPNQLNFLKNLFPNERQFTAPFLRRKATPAFPSGYTSETLDITPPKLPQRFERTAVGFAPDGTAYGSTRTEPSGETETTNGRSSNEKPRRSPKPPSTNSTASPATRPTAISASAPA